MPVVHDFDAKLAESDNNRVRALVHKGLHDRFGSDYLQIHKAALANDRHGADYVAEFRHGQTRLIEAKVRAEDWLPRGQDADLALETWADIDKQVVGWTRDTAAWPPAHYFSAPPRQLVDEVRARHSDAPLGAARFSFDVSEARWAWRIGIGEPEDRIAYVSPAGWYEKPAGRR